MTVVFAWLVIFTFHNMGIGNRACVKSQLSCAIAHQNDDDDVRRASRTGWS